MYGLLLLGIEQLPTKLQAYLPCSYQTFGWVLLLSCLHRSGAQRQAFDVINVAKEEVLAMLRRFVIDHTDAG